MIEYRKYISALRQCAKEHEKDKTPTFQIKVSDLCEDTARLLENDVVERSKIDKAIEEMKNEIKFWSEKSTDSKPYTAEIREAKANSYKHALEIFKEILEQE